MRTLFLLTAITIAVVACETSNEYQNNSGTGTYQNRKDTGGVDRDYPRNNNGEWPRDTPHYNGADTTVRDRMPGTK